MCLMIPRIESFRLIPYMTNIIGILGKLKFFPYSRGKKYSLVNIMKTKRDNDMKMVSTPTNAMILNILVPSFALLRRF